MLQRVMGDIYQGRRSHIQIASYCMQDRYIIRAEESHYAKVELNCLYNHLD